MKISYEHANPQHGNESFLIRVQEPHEEHTPCILVDAGDGVDIETLLGTDEYLVAVLLTHAHMDHYQSLPSATQPGVPILTSPDTAAILNDVLAEGNRNFDLGDTKKPLEQVEPITDWTDVLGETISIRTIPAGHTPGACGFLIRIQDGEDTIRILATGDFTVRDAAGYPGLDPSPYFDVDILFLTAATADAVDDYLTDIIGTIAEQTNAGSRTLCTTGGLTGVHLATLLAAVDDTLDYSLPVILVGQVAKLYDSLGYDHANINTVPEFHDPTTCLAHGAVTIAGPEVPVEGSSHRLFKVLQEDPNAALVQVQGGGTTAKNAGDFTGTVESFRFSNHPDEDVLDEVVETMSPTHVVVEHQSGRSLQRYKKKWNAFTWATGDSGEEILYREGLFVAPYWVGDEVEQRVRNRDGQSSSMQIDDDVLDAATTLPVVGQQDAVSLEAEGVDLAALRNRLHVTPTSATATPSTTPSENSGEDTQRSVTDGGLHRTVGAELSLEDCPDFPQEDDDSSSSSRLINTVGPSSSSESDAAESEPTEHEAASDTDKSATQKTDETSHIPAEQQSTTDGPIMSKSKTTEASETQSTEPTSETGEPIHFEIDSGVRALTEHRAATSTESLDKFVYAAVESYLTAALRGDEPWTEDPKLVDRDLSVDMDPALEQLIAGRIDAADTNSIETFILETLCEELEFDNEDQTFSLHGLESLTSLITAVTENDNCPYDSQDQVIQAALEAKLL
jgi:putative mRNA 3-end processing factor